MFSAFYELPNFLDKMCVDRRRLIFTKIKRRKYFLIMIAAYTIQPVHIAVDIFAEFF